MPRWFRKIHLIATAIVGVQLLAWTLTGFAFTLFDFRTVHGDDDRAEATSLDLGAVRLRPDEAARRGLRVRPGAHVRAVRLEMLADRPAYVVALGDGGESGEVVVDAASGELVSVDAELAARVATLASRERAAVRDVVRTRDEGRDVFVVRLADARDTDVLVDAGSGEIAGWHNRTWRTFDALWSVHVLGYVDRHSPAHWPMRILGLLGAVAAVSGAALLLVRFRPRRQRRPTPKLSPLEQP